MKTLALFLFVLPSFAFANLETSLEVLRVVHSKTNQIASGSPASETCSNFKGTFEGSTVVVKPVAKGGSGRYSHQLVWTLSESYKTFDGVQTQRQASVRNGNSYSIKLPQLKDEVSWIQQPVFVITTDLSTRQTATKQLLFNVTRPVVLTPSQKPESLSQGCFQVMPAFESVAGILSNGSTNPSQILIRQGIQNIWNRTSGSQWGFYFSPLAWSVVGNVFSISRSYFSQFSRQTIETIEVSSGYTLTPGDFVQLYEQRTRYIQVFDAKLVNGCGESQELEGEYFLQWWGVAYHAVPVNPYENERAPVETIGARPVNHCPDELTPEFARDENGSFIFSRTL
jgi:hypothetical protein